jgi:AhpD family alkylhydroperoxidase
MHDNDDPTTEDTMHTSSGGSTFRIPKATITGVYGRVLTAYTRRTWGQVPDNAHVLWHNRKVMKAVFSFEQKVAKFDALDHDLSVLAQAATAATVGCSWCLDFGYYLAHSEGMDLEKIREVMRWRESDVFSPLEREVLGYAEAMSTTPLTVTDEMVASLVRELGEPATVELTMMVAIENERARFNSAAGLKAQGFSDVCEIPLPPLRAVASGS